MKQEIWKDIPGYEGLYQASNLGRVKGLFRYKKILKPILKKDGYFNFNLYKNKKSKSYRGHRLVASAFLGMELKFKGNNLVCHKDDNRKNNKLCNLFIGTYLDNNLDTIRKGRGTDNSGENNGMNKYSKNKIIEVIKMIKNGYKNIEIERELGVYNRVVSDIRHKKRWKNLQFIIKA